MKNTRKKMLLSSIAMLLVALIALGSATFAWYVTNDTVKAKNATFSAAAANGLVIRNVGDTEWLSEVTVGAKRSMMPASTNYATALGSLIAGYGDGTEYDDGTLVGDLTKISDITNDAKIFYKQVEVASSSGDSDCYLQVKGNTVAGTYMTVLVYDSNSSLVGKWTSEATGNGTTTSSIKVKSGDNTKCETDATDISLTRLTTYNHATKYTAPSKDGSGTPLKFTIVAYADGYNENCKNSKANTEDVSVDLNFKTSAWS